MAGKPRALAIAAHPDDIEFQMAGTLLHLADAGWDVHYFNVANGSCGTATEDRDAIVRRRTAESADACRRAGFTFHPPLVDDLMVYYAPELVAKVLGVVRAVRPAVVFTQSPEDYMEDHQNASRLAVTATFARGMRNAACDPPSPPVAGDCLVYHALPHGLVDGLRRPVPAELFVDVGAVMDRKRALLACHASQKEWLDASQGMDSYLNTMADLTAVAGKASGRFVYAEGWRRRGHLGFTARAEDDPLAAALAPALLHRVRGV